MSISDNIRKFREQVPAGVQVVAISKTKPDEDILEAYNAGQRIFGENRVQDLIAKQPRLPGDIQWHFVGHLQTNKVKYIVPFISMVQSVDSLKLLQVIDREALKHNRVIHCLLQVHIAEEETKFGLSETEASGILESESYPGLKNIRIDGLMGMATYTDNEEQLRKEFRRLTGIFRRLKTGYFKEEEHFREISMGMSGDYRIAIEEGSTMIRIGTMIFGARFKNLSL